MDETLEINDIIIDDNNYNNKSNIITIEDINKFTLKESISKIGEYKSNEILKDYLRKNLLSKNSMRCSDSTNTLLNELQPLQDFPIISPNSYSTKPLHSHSQPLQSGPLFNPYSNQ